MIRRTTLAVALAAAVVVPVAHADGPASSAEPTGPCAGGRDGGEWSSYGRDLTGSRHQTDEDLIDPANVSELTPAWISESSVAHSGVSTPVVAGRCVYVSGGGKVSAIDVVDGGLVWQTPLPLGGSSYAVSVADGFVHVSMDIGSQTAATKLDAQTGQVVATSEPIDFGYALDQVAGAIVWDGKHLMPTNGPDSDPFARPGIAVFDTSDMSTLSKHTTIPVEDLDRGYAGGGIWATPVVDEVTGYAYVGTAQPYSKQREHERDNAIVQIDLRGSPGTNPTFGQVVASYKGDPDDYFSGRSDLQVNDQPACDIAGDSVQYHPSGFSVACVQFDVDFGASPTLFSDGDGRTIVGELQKSGTFHAVYADTMQPAWTQIVSTLPPATGGNTSSSASDGSHVFVMANPGVVYSLAVDDGAIEWVTPLAIGTLENHPVQVANGVVYVQMNSFHVYGLDSVSGAILWETNAALDAQTFCSQPAGGGIAIAAHTVIVNCDGTLVAYRLPEGD